ncbi:MAG TPA: cupin domain-containing protein [Gemmatimonadaceae bacterium]
MPQITFSCQTFHIVASVSRGSCIGASGFRGFAYAMRQGRSAMCRFASTLLLAAGFTIGGAHATLGQGADSTSGMKVTSAESVAWTNPEVPGFDPGMKLAVIEGNPDAAGPYTIRLSFPDGYRFPAHWHPNAENLTVLTGNFQLAMGTKADDAKLQSYEPGDFLYIEAKHPHFGGARGATVVQLHGQGPFTINLVEKPTP